MLRDGDLVQRLRVMAEFPDRPSRYLLRSRSVRMPFPLVFLAQYPCMARKPCRSRSRREIVFFHGRAHGAISGMSKYCHNAGRHARLGMTTGTGSFSEDRKPASPLFMSM